MKITKQQQNKFIIEECIINQIISKIIHKQLKIVLKQNKTIHITFIATIKRLILLIEDLNKIEINKNKMIH
jgi:hypothetical protein